MILRRLRVENFGCLGTGEWEFSPGINLVHGPNEAGKSTLAEAIAKALLGQRPADTGARDYRRWQSWNAREMFVLEAEFDHGGHGWRVVRDFQNGREELECLDDGRRTTGAVRERLAEMVGLSPDHSEQQYLATAFLRQGEWAEVAQAADLQDVVARALLAGGSREQPLVVLASLQKRHTEYARGLVRAAPKNPGPVAVARDRVTELEEKLSAAEGLRAQAEKEEQARAELAEASEKLQQVQARLSELTPRIEAGRQWQELSNEKQKLEKQAKELENRIASVQRLQRELAEAERLLETLPEISAEQVAALEQQMRQAEALRQQAEGARQKAETEAAAAEETREKLKALPSPPPADDVDRARRLEDEKRLIEDRIRQQEAAAAAQRQGRARRATIAAGMFAVAVVLGIAAALPAVPGWARVLAGAFAAAALVGGAILMARRGLPQGPPGAEGEEAARKLKEISQSLTELLRQWECQSAAELAQKRAALVDARAELERQLAQHETSAQQYSAQASEAEEKAEQLTTEVQSKFTQWGVAGIAEARSVALQRLEAQRDADRARAALAELLGEKTEDDLRQAHVRLLGEIEKIQGELVEPSVAAAQMSDQELAALELEAAELEEEERRLARRVASAQGTVEAYRGAAARLIATEQALEQARRELKGRQRFERVLAAAVELLEEAIEEVRTSANEAILPRAEELLARLTAQRYRSLKIDQGRPLVHVDALGRAVAPEEALSYATREQVYLAVRLAMYVTLWPDEGPPLILDEPLLAFDEGRTAAALEVLQQMGQGRQIIVLSATDTYHKIADTVIELRQPA